MVLQGAEGCGPRVQIITVFQHWNYCECKHLDTSSSKDYFASAARSACFF